MLRDLTASVGWESRCGIAGSSGPEPPMAAASGAPMGQARLPGSSTRCWRVSCLWAVGSGSRSGPRELLGIVSLSPWSRGHLHRASHDSSGFVRGRERNGAGEGRRAAGRRSRPSVTSVRVSLSEESHWVPPTHKGRGLHVTRLAAKPEPNK